MTTATFGKITVTGTDAQCAFATKVYAGASPDLPFPGNIEPKAFPIEFHTAAEFLAQGLVIPGTENPKKSTPQNPKGGKPAYGYTRKNALWINSDTRPRDQAYALEHEPFHPIFAANLTADKLKTLSALIQKVANGTPYQNRPSEVWCDAMVELFYGHSILDSYYGDIPDADLRTAWDTLIAPENAPPVPVDPPAPLPLPDPLQAQVDALTAQVAALTDRIAKKDAAMQEGLAA